MKVWFFDAENKSHRIAQLNKDILVLGVDRGFDRFNFLEPPSGVTVHKWIPILVELMVNEFTLLDAGTSFLRDSIFECIEEFGNEIPSLIDVLEFIKRRFRMIKKGRSSREVEWAASVINRLSSIVNELRPVLDCNRGFDFEKLLKRSLIFQLRDLSKLSRNLYVKIMCLKLYHRQMSRETGDKYLVILDEAHIYFPRSGDYRDSTNFLVTLMWQARKRGIYFLTASPSPDAISKACLNSGVVSSFSQGGKAGIQEIESPLLLNEAMKYEISQLQKRTAIIKTPHFPQPVRFQVSDFSPPELSQVDCDIMMQPQLSELFYDVVKVKPQTVQQKKEMPTQQTPNPPTSQSQPEEKPELREKHVTFLTNVKEYPWLKDTARRELLGFSPNIYTTIRDELLIMRYLLEEKFEGRRGSPKFVHINEKGKGGEWLKQVYGPNTKVKKGRGSAKHTFGVVQQERNLIKKFGKKVKTEKWSSKTGKEIDVIARFLDSGEAWAFEFTLTTNNALSNAKHCLKYFQCCVLVFENQITLKKVEKQAKKQLNKEKLNKTRFEVLKL